MDMEDPAAFMGTFRRNDQETIQIMAKAAKIVPQACDILGISLSDSESEVEDDVDDTALEQGERSQLQSSPTQPQPEEDKVEDYDRMMVVDNRHRQVQDARPKPNFRARLLTPPARASGLEAALGSHVRKSRKRCASTPSALNSGQSNPSASSESLCGLIPPTTKKRRLHSISSLSGLGSGITNNSATASGTATTTSRSLLTNGFGLGGGGGTWPPLKPEHLAIRKRMEHDMELLQQQFTLLDEMEKVKVALFQRYVQIKQGVEYQQQKEEEATPPIHLSTATTATNNGNGMQEGDEGAQIEEETNGQQQGEKDAPIIMGDQVTQEIFTDEDLEVAAEEIVGGDSNTDARGEDSEIGSLM